MRLSTRARRLLAGLFVLVGFAAVPVALAPAANAATMCGPRVTLPPNHSPFTKGQFCPIWTAAPVQAGTDNGATVGHLGTPGDGNWFVCRISGASRTVSGFTSKDWALTESDGPQFAQGFVSAVYFNSSATTWLGLPTCPNGI